MKIKVRLATPQDFPEIVELARSEVAETRPTLEFNEEKCLASLYGYMEKASPTVYVAARGGEVIGMLVAEMYEHRMADGLFTTQEVLYVRPDHRGTRAAALLMETLIAWSQGLGATEIIGGNDNEFQSERTAKFLEHFGFERVGIAMRRVL